jgi:transglutaminase-like putative cysteine protease
MVILRRWIALLSVLVLGQAAESSPAASNNWRPVTPQDMRLTAATIGDPDADAAILFREGYLNDNGPDPTNLRVYIRIKIFNDRGRRYADVQLPYRAELGRVSDVTARTIRPNGSVVEVNDRDIFDVILLKTVNTVWRAKVFSMPAVEPGSIIEYRYRQTYTRGFRYFQLDLQSELFTRELRYSIQPQAASRLDVRWAKFNTPTDSKQFDAIWDGTFNIKAENIPPFRREPLMPPELAVKMWGWIYYTNEISTDADKYWRDYAQRMHDRVSDETTPTRDVRRAVELITLSTESQRDTIKRIYTYVQKEIFNVGAKDSEGDFLSWAALKKSDSPEEVIRRRYGTPREINRLFVAMMRAAGFDARVAELTTRDENFFKHAFPDSFQLNGEITALITRDGPVQFFDPGTPHCPLGMLSWEKEAVTALIYGKRDWSFTDTPLTDATRNSQERSTSVTLLPDGKVDARVEMKASGQFAIGLRNRSIDPNSDVHHKDIVASVRKVLPEAVINESSVALSNLTDFGEPFKASYSFSVPRFATRSEKRLLLKPALLNHPDENLLKEPRRVNSVYFQYPWSEVERVEIETPGGYEVEQLPEAVSLDIGAASYEARFRREANRVVFERRMTVNGFFIRADQYPALKGFFDLVHQADRAAISFKQQE